jgi:hypothetical protein
MNHFLIAFKEEQANVEYCTHCLFPRAEKTICCEKSDWLEFKYMDDNTQQRVAEEEYEWHHHRNEQ